MLAETVLGTITKTEKVDYFFLKKEVSDSEAKALKSELSSLRLLDSALEVLVVNPAMKLIDVEKLYEKKGKKFALFIF